MPENSDPLLPIPSPAGAIGSLISLFGEGATGAGRPGVGAALQGVGEGIQAGDSLAELNSKLGTMDGYQAGQFTGQIAGGAAALGILNGIGTLSGSSLIGGMLGGAVAGEFGVLGGLAIVGGFAGAVAGGAVIGGLIGGIAFGLMLGGFEFPSLCPLVLDLDGDGLELTTLAGSTAMFDIDGDGFAERVAWVTGGDGLLAVDANGSGRIENISELFGGSAGGFSKLATFDSNNDGVINSSDANFSQLKVWVDGGVKGFTETGELHSLSELGITSLSLSAAPSTQVISGNSIAATSTFIMNGTAHLSADALFDVAQAISAEVDTPIYVDEGVVFLPNLGAIGNVVSLHTAATNDADVKAALISIVEGREAYASFEDFRTDVQELMLKWFGVDDVDPTSRGANIDARHLSALEKIMDQFYSSATASPSETAGQDLEAIWNTIVDQEATRLLVEVAGYSKTAAFFPAILDVMKAIVADPSLPQATINEQVADAIALIEANPTQSALMNEFAGLHFSSAADAIAGADLSGYGSDLFGIAENLQLHPPVGGSTPEYERSLADAWRKFLAVARSSNDPTLAGLVTDAEGYLGATYLTRSDGYTHGDNADNVLVGTKYNDLVIGYQGQDTISGGAGADTLAGQHGNDTYVYGAGDGDDVIREASIGDANDSLVLHGIAPGAVTIQRSVPDNLKLTFAGGGSVTLAGQFNFYGYDTIETIRFDDGTVWTADSIKATLLAQASTSGDDLVVAFTGPDTLTGGLGNDTLQGGNSNDVYVYTAGDGNDVISDNSLGDPADTLILHGVAPGAVTLQRPAPDDLLISFSGGGSVKIAGQFNYYGSNTIETIRFDDGTVWTPDIIKATLLAQAGTPGNDLVIAFTGADTLAGGLGNDTLQGGNGDDVYIYTAGDGNDVIAENSGGNPADTLILHGVAPGAVTLQRPAPDDLLISFSGGSIKLAGQFNYYGSEVIETIRFDDGAVWTPDVIKTTLLVQAGTPGNDLVVAFTGADTLAGGLGNDTLQGGNGNDVYVYTAGDGDDVVTETGSGSPADALVLHGLAPGDVTVRHSAPDDITLSFAGGGSVRLAAQLNYYGWDTIEAIRFDDGTTWSSQDVLDRAMGQTGTAGSDSLLGFSTPDLLDGGASADTLNGAGGDDTLTGGSGVDVLTGGAGADRFVYTAPGDAPLGSTSDLITDFGQGSDQIDLSAIDANAGVAGDQAFLFIGTAAFSNVAGQLRYEASPSGARTIFGDVDGDGLADFQIQVTGSTTFAASDFLL